MTGLEILGFIGVTVLALFAVKYIFNGGGISPDWSNGGLPR